MAQHVALYLRKSPSPGTVDASYEKQRRWAEVAATDWFAGLPVVEYGEDGAWSGDDPARPAYGRLLDAVRAGDVAGVLAWEQSRLARDEVIWGLLCRDLDAAGIENVHTVNGPIAVSGDASLVGRITAVVDAHEKARTRRRSIEGVRVAAFAGAPPAGLVYGYRRRNGTLEVDQGQAAVVRRIVDELDAGVTLRRVADALNDDGVRTPRDGAFWRPQSVRSVALNPTISGRRSYHGEVVATGVWEPIVTPEEQKRVAVIVASRGPTSPRSGNRRRYLLSGLLRCGECGGPLVADLSYRRHGPPERAYACRARDCRRVSISPAKSLDTYITDMVLAALDLDALAHRLAVSDDERARLTAKLAVAEQRRAEAADLFADGAIDASQIRTITDSTRLQADRARRALESLNVAVANLPDLSTVAEAWATLAVEQRRSVLDLVLDRVDVSHARPGRLPAGVRFEAERLHPVWRF